VPDRNAPLADVVTHSATSWSVASDPVRVPYEDGSPVALQLDSYGSIRYDPCNCMQLFRALTLEVAVLLTAAATASAQVPRASDGHPDLSGMWQAMGTANWDLEDHAPEAGPFYHLGAIGAIPPGRGVVEGGDIPYKTDALAKRKENRANRKPKTQPRKSSL
jgi:hypothetical protein